VRSDQFICEVGSGHGHFLTAYAQAHPAEVCVGIDIIGERVARATRKRDRAGLGQLHFLHAEARLFFETLPPAVLISKIFILFPDPWPKKRHHKHRIIQPDFLRLLRSRVRADAQLFFRTDHRPYFDYAQATVSEHPEWRLTAAAWPFEHETVFQQRAETHHSLAAEPRH
jgi:tRNA (guanine-N7-)-methyltransferase